MTSPASVTTRTMDANEAVADVAYRLERGGGDLPDHPGVADG